jgi:ATP-dependent protease ClpP protease subunit
MSQTDEHPTEPKEKAPSHCNVTASYSAILEEHNIAGGQRKARVHFLEEMERKEMNDGSEKNAVIAQISKEGSMGSSLEASDLPVLGNLLRSVGDVDTLTLLLHSPGGDGTCVEKIVTICRAQCKHFRVIIPNRAKSAATMIALGADEIVMGNTSEIGPIDAQVVAVVAGVPRYVSAQSFIDAREDLLEKYKIAKKAKEDVKPYLQMFASLDIPYIQECQRMMDFGRDVVRGLLTKYMFAGDADAQQKADKVVGVLSSVKKHKVHGRIIDGNTARTELGLKVKLLPKDDLLWQKVWEYYTRAEISLGRSNSPKMFETRHEVLMARMG